MPLIHLITNDMFEVEDVCDYMVNPVNLVGVMGKGLALEFKNRAPDCMEPYKEACKSGDLRIGTVQVLEDTGNAWGMINFPTKRHYVDTSDRNDIARGLEALRDLLKTDKYRYSSVCMPMLGCGLGKQDYEVVYPMMIDYLAELETTVFLSMSPDRTEMRPRYLTIVGPPSYMIDEDNKKVVDSTIDKVMNAWGQDLSDYAGIVSGGYPGIDSYVCGETFLKDKEQSYTFKKTGQTPLVVKVNKQRNGVTANLRHNELLCQISEDIILFKPVGHNNNRMALMQVWLNCDKKMRHEQGLPARRVAIFGEHAIASVQEQVLIPVEGGDDF